MAREKWYTAVFVSGGLISTVTYGTGLHHLIDYMKKECARRGFDPDTDDARIYDSSGQELFSYATPAELEQDGTGDYICPKCQRFERIVLAHGSFWCEACLTAMVPLDPQGGAPVGDAPCV